MSDRWENHLHSRLDQWRGQGLARELATVSGTGVRFSLDGHQIVSFASNDYLGLASHPAVIAGAKAALDASGAGASASPLICGHKSEHHKLENELAAFKRSETALVFGSGYQAAIGALAALVSTEDSIILDRLSHASLIDGAHLSGGRVCTFKHNDIENLKHILDREKERRCLVVVESLYSMDGDLAPLSEITAICLKSNALLLVDEAHATGVFGEHGQGLLEEVTGQNGKLPEHVIAMGTLSKALGCQGGFVCANRTIIQTILHAGRSYLFSTALSPACVGGARAALRLIETEPERRRHVLELGVKLREALTARAIPVLVSNGPIVPIPVESEKFATECKNALLQLGFFVPAIRYPTVKKGQARLRVSLSANHSESDCLELVDALMKIKTRK